MNCWVCGDRGGMLLKGATPYTGSTQPTNLARTTKVEKGKLKVTLTWNPSSDNFELRGYRIYRDSSALPNLAGGTSYVDTLSQKGTHTYYVVATDGAGNLSVPSNVVSVTK